MAVMLSLVALLLSGCTPDGGDTGGGGGSVADTGAVFERGETVRIVLGADAEDAAIMLQGALSEALGVVPVLVTDESEPADCELVIGNTSREISKRALSFMDREERSGKYLPRYTIYSSGGSVAIVFDSCEGYDDFIAGVAAERFISEYVKDGEAVNMKSGSYRSGTADVLAYQESIDEERVNSEWAAIESKVGADITAALKDMYVMYEDKALDWLADLYEPKLGGFYSGNSARDNEGFLPCIESTSQAMDFLRLSGMLKEYGNDLKKALPVEFQAQMVAFVKGLQDPISGYFYHPQWGKELTDKHLARRGRDLTKGLDLLQRLGASPTYTTPNGVEGDGILADGTPVSRISLTSPISDGRTSAVSKLLAVSAVKSASHLDSISAFKNYLSNLDINFDPYSVGNEIASTVSEIKAKGDEYVKIIKDWLDEHCYESTGHWYHLNDYMGLNGLMKISAAYQGLGIPLPYPEKNADFAIDMITTTEDEETVCYAYNTWFAVGNVLQNVRRHCTTAEADRIISDVMDRIYGDAPALIASTHQKQLKFRMPDGAFTYSVDHPSYLSQGLPSSVPGIIESGINASLICINDTLSHIYHVLGFAVDGGLPMVSIYTKSDLLRFLDRIEGLQPVIKRPEQIYKSTAVFDEDKVGASPSEVKVQNQSESVVKVISDPRTGASRSGKVLEFDAKAGGAKSITMPMDVSANPLFHCYVFEGEYCFESFPDGYMSHLNVGPECYMIGFKGATDKATGKKTVYLYEESSDSGAASREVDLGVGIPAGEWFSVRVEFYIKDTAEPRIKLYVNDRLVTVTDNFYNRSGTKLDGDKAVPKTRYEGATFLVFSYYDARVLMDNLACYRIRDEYQPIDPEKETPRFNVDAPDRDEIIYDFEAEDIGAGPDGIISQDVHVVPDSDGHAISLVNGSYATFPVNVRTRKTVCTVFEADILLSSSAGSKSIIITFTENARVPNSIACYGLKVEGSVGYIYNAPTGVIADKVDGARLPLDTEFTFRAEYYDIDRTTLFYVNGELIASSATVSHNAQKYVTEAVKVSSGTETTLDNVICERIIKDYDEAIRPKIDSKPYSFTFELGDVTAFGNAKAEGGFLVMGSGSKVSVPVNQRSVVNTATVFETLLMASEYNSGSSFRMTLLSTEGKAILSYDVVAEGNRIYIYERTSAGTYESPLYSIPRSARPVIGFVYHSARSLAYLTVNGVTVAASHLSYDAESFDDASGSLEIEVLRGTGPKLDNLKLESYNVVFIDEVIPKTENPDSSSDIITYEGSSSGNIPDNITTDLGSVGSSLSVREQLRAGALTKVLYLVTRPDYNDALSVSLTRDNDYYNCTVFETDIRFVFPTGDTSFQIYLESDEGIVYMINMNKDGDGIIFNDTSGTGSVRNRGPRIRFDGGEQWHKIRIEYYAGSSDTVRFKTYIDGKLVLVSNNFWGSEIDGNQPKSKVTEVRFYTYQATDAVMMLDNTSLVRTTKTLVDDPLTEEETPDTPAPDAPLGGTVTFEEDSLGIAPKRIAISKTDEYGSLAVISDPRDGANKILRFYKYNTTETDAEYHKHAPVVTIPLTDTRDGYNAYVFEADIKLDYLYDAISTNYKMYLGTPDKTVYTFEFYKSGGYLTFRDSSNISSGISSGPIPTVTSIYDWFNFRLEYYLGDQDTVRIKIYLDDILVYVSNNFYGPTKNDAVGTKYTVNNEVTELRIVPYGDMQGTMYLDNVDLKQAELALKNDPVGIPTVGAPEETEPFDAKVLPIKGGAGSIVVLVHDDGDLASAAILDKLYKKYSLKGDVAITAERFLTPNAAEIHGWQSLLDTGRWGMLNHSMTHDFWGNTETGEIDEALVTKEVLTSRELLRSVFPTENFHVYAYPGISYVTNKFGLSVYDAVMRVVRENYLAGRFYGGGSADLYDWDWENMPTYAVDLNSQNTLDAVERAVKGGEFISILMHRVLPDAEIDANPAYQSDHYYTRESHITKVCEKLGGYVSSGAVWSANYEDAVLYLREAENARLTVTRSGNRITARVDDGLDDSVYNYPLTVRISVDAEVEAVRITQGERVSYARRVTQNGIGFIDAEMIPDNTDTVIEVIPLSEIPTPELPDTDGDGSIDFGGNNKDDSAWS